MDKTRKIPVTSRASGKITYSIPALRIKRTWYSSGDVVNIPIDELIELTTVEGGRRILDEFLLISDKEARGVLYDYELAPEYDYTEAEVIYLLQEGTDTQLLDALDYAPEGVLYLIRSLAVRYKPNTLVKLNAINEKFKINLLNIINNAEETEMVQEENEKTPRRSEPVTVDSASKYKVVKRKS